MKMKITNSKKKYVGFLILLSIEYAPFGFLLNLADFMINTPFHFIGIFSATYNDERTQRLYPFVFRNAECPTAEL